MFTPTSRHRKNGRAIVEGNKLGTNDVRVNNFLVYWLGAGLFSVFATIPVIVIFLSGWDDFRFLDDYRFAFYTVILIVLPCLCLGFIGVLIFTNLIIAGVFSSLTSRNIEISGVKMLIFFALASIVGLVLGGCFLYFLNDIIWYVLDFL
jgi:hypothetical protein